MATQTLTLTAVNGADVRAAFETIAARIKECSPNGTSRGVATLTIVSDTATGNMVFTCTDSNGTFTKTLTGGTAA
jgi:hypothetical protein